MTERLVTAAVGVWLMVAPAVIGYGGALADSDRTVGPVVVAVSIVAVAGVLRPLRWVLVPLGAWVAMAPMLLGGELVAVASGLAAGVAIVALSWRRGAVRRPYGGGWRAVLGHR